MQSWINGSNYNTYKVSYIEDILLTGNYNDVKKYEDYITIKTDSSTKEKTLNINNFIKTEQINKKNEYEDLDIEIEVLYKDVYMTYESYKIRVINKSEKDILLDDFTNISNNLKLVNGEDIEYRFRQLNAFMGEFAISSNIKKDINIDFIKNYGSGVKGKYILLKRFIKDYSKYRMDKENYNEYEEIKISL